MTTKKTMAKCPFCAEKIQPEAVKCKHCGSMLNQTNPANIAVKANQHPSYAAFTALSLILPLVGLIVGIVFLTKQDLLDRKVGEHTIAISILGFIISFAIISFVI